MGDLNEFFEWAKEKPKTRQVDIAIKNGKANIWVWDAALVAGEFVKDVAEIDLEKQKNKKDRREYERLKAIFEGRTSV